MKACRKQATVIEFFYPGGFSFDYEFTTRGLGMRHFGVWGDRCVEFLLRFVCGLTVS